MNNLVIFGALVLGAIIVGRVGTIIADKYFRKSEKDISEEIESTPLEVDAPDLTL